MRSDDERADTFRSLGLCVTAASARVGVFAVAEWERWSKREMTDPPPKLYIN